VGCRIEPSAFDSASRQSFRGPRNKTGGLALDQNHIFFERGWRKYPSRPRGYFGCRPYPGLKAWPSRSRAGSADSRFYFEIPRPLRRSTKHNEPEYFPILLAVRVFARMPLSSILRSLPVVARPTPKDSSLCYESWS